MKISICIPTFERPALLEIAVTSAINQTFQPLEIIVGDDSRSDHSEAVVQRLMKSNAHVRIIYQRNRPGLGQSANVQRLFEIASGDAICLLHDDDFLYRDALAVLSRPLEVNPDVVCVFGRQTIVSEAGVVNERSTWSVMADYGKGKEVHAGPVADGFLAGALKIIPNDGYLVRAKIALGINYHDNGRSSSACDFYFGLRLGASGGQLYFVEEFVSAYRLTENSISSGGTDSGFFQMRILLEDYPDRVCPKVAAALSHTVKLAIATAADLDYRQGWRWYFGRFHITSILTLGGLSRFLLLAAASLGMKGLAVRFGRRV